MQGKFSYADNISFMFRIVMLCCDKLGDGSISS